MSTKLEIIPGVLGNLTPRSITKFYGRTCRFYDVISQEEKKENEYLDGEGYTIECSNKSYFLKKIKQDFDVDSAIDLFEGEEFSGLEPQSVATQWEKIGYSYFISSDDPLQDESEYSFLKLVAAICISLGGGIFLQKSLGDVCSGIYSGESWLKLID